jgi:thymidylate kinase
LDLDKSKVYIFDRTIYSLFWFAYAKWKIDKLNYWSTINDKEYKNKINKIDFIFIIKINNDIRNNRLDNDIFRKNNTPELFYRYDFNEYNNYYLDNIDHNKKFYINWNDSIENILNFILKTIWKSI